MELYNMYRPITATPFRNNENYVEIEPCDALKPYIRCYWGSRGAVKQGKSNIIETQIITPDTCMDIIFLADITNNRRESTFHGMDDRTFTVHNVVNENISILSFAIRFYAWGAVAFAEDSMRNTKNAFFDVGYHFPKIKKEIEEQLFDIKDIYQLVPVVEKILLKRLNERHQNQTVLRAVHKIVEDRGNISMTDLKHETFVGERQLERLFGEYAGISPKSLASVVRYQCLWNDLLYHEDFNILDAVYKYGYSDQAHLCRDFKKYHSINITDARKFAMQNVGNIQDAASRS